MSGTIAQAVGLGSLGLRSIERVGEAFGIAGPVMLGDFVFERFEVPESITIDGQQQMTVHRMPGGARVIDVMGRDDAPISWSGVMLGPQAATRERTLRELKVAGRAIPLMFGAYYYTVIIRQFTATYTRDSYIPYQISCEVLRDEAAEVAFPFISTALQVAGDVASAVLNVAEMSEPPPMPARADGKNIPSPSVALAAAQAASDEAARDGFRRGTAVQAACAASMAIARASVSDGLAGAGAAVAGIAARAPAGSIVPDVAALRAALTSCEQMARLGAALGSTARAEQNAVLGSV